MVNPINFNPEMVQVEIEEKQAQWQKYVKEGKEILNSSWMLGDLVERIAKDVRYGQSTIKKFADEIGIRPNSLYQYWKTARSFPPKYREKYGDDVSFYFFYYLAISYVAQEKWDELLGRVVIEKLTIEKFRKLLNSFSEKDDSRGKPNKKSVVGDIINFRGLVYAPLNENGVIFLFGKVVEDMNMYVEEIKPGFPDCIGRRRTGNGQWEKVRIEFEDKSSNFKDHNHNSKDCDLIVCWKNDWFDCPLEVIELREEIKSFPNE